MALKIKQTGLDEYTPGGVATLKVMLIGGPGVGKTRFSSYWPQPFYLDCEGGLASVADRQVPYASIHNSKDMLDALVYLKQDSMRDVLARKYRTVIVDTLDAFQRKVKDEWIQLNPGAKAFSGYEAWNYLDSKMQMLLTRLLNLDMNVIVAVHYTEKHSSDDDDKDKTSYVLQLQGSVKDTVFNDFDLVGWMGGYWATVDGQRVEQRGLTFTPTEARPFLKDRLHATPKWLQINFEEDDYVNLFMAVVNRLDSYPESIELGEIPDSDEGDREVIGTAGVVAPGTSGALPEQDPRDIPLSSLDRPTLAKIARDEGVTVTVAGVPIKSNTIKAELLAAIEAKRAGTLVTPAVAEPATSTPSEQTSVESGDDGGLAPNEVVDPATGEITTATPAATEAEAIETVLTIMPGSEVIETREVQQTPTEAPAEVKPEFSRDDKFCTFEGCGKDLSKENPNHVKLSFIKCRRNYCSEHYLATR